MIQKAALLGGGVIGGGWAARLLANNVAVCIYDPAPAAKDTVLRTLHTADHTLSQLLSAPRPPMQQPQFVTSIAAAVHNADIIIESAPERPDIKKQLYAEAEQAAPPDSLITSSTSGILPSQLQEGMKHPERFIVAHPFNPVYLLPLVELVGGKQTSPQAISTAANIFTELGMHPLHIKKEIDAFIADRLMEAVWREALWLVKDGIADTGEIDDAIRMGFGLRWAQMGLFETFRIAGGEKGMAHFLAQFGPCLKWPWTKLTDVPDMNDAFAKLIAAQSDAQSGKHTSRELERIRDDNVLAFLHTLKANQWGAGKSLAAWEKTLHARARENNNAITIASPMRLLSRRVPQHWTDYNGHMNESRYLECFSDATDALMKIIGADDDYIAAGKSYFTVETHIRHLNEALAGGMLHADVRVLQAEGKKLRLFHELIDDSGNLVATGEHLLIHVDLATRRSSLPSAPVQEKALAIATAHAKLPPPEGAGKW